MSRLPVAASGPCGPRSPARPSCTFGSGDVLLEAIAARTGPCRPARPLEKRTGEDATAFRNTPIRRVSLEIQGNILGTTCLLRSLILTLMASQPEPEAPGTGPRTLKGHSGSVMAVGFAPDGTTLASGSRDGTIKLWHVKTGELQRTLEAHAEDVYAVAFSPDGKMIATGSADRTIRRWDRRTGRVIRTLEGHGDIVRSVAFA